MFLTATVCEDSTEGLLQVGRMAGVGEEMGVIHAQLARVSICYSESSDGSPVRLRNESK